MANVKIHAGDFRKGNSTAHFGSFALKTDNDWLIGESIPFSELESVEVATEESVKRLGGTIGWGVVGAAALGPIGFLAGLLLGGRRNEVTFVAKFKDGRKMLATTDSTLFKKLQAAVFR
jgi:hypothetical protein